MDVAWSRLRREWEMDPGDATTRALYCALWRGGARTWDPRKMRRLLSKRPVWEGRLALYGPLFVFHLWSPFRYVAEVHHNGRNRYGSYADKYTLTLYFQKPDRLLNPSPRLPVYQKRISPFEWRKNGTPKRMEHAITQSATVHFDHTGEVAVMRWLIECHFRRQAWEAA